MEPVEEHEARVEAMQDARELVAAACCMDPESAKRISQVVLGKV